jgi:hypothetical protein
MVDKIILIASALTAASTILAIAIKVYKFVRKCDKWIEKKDKHDEEQYCNILRLIIMTPEMPLSERIAAGDIYVNKLHRNGGVKKKYEELLDRFSEEHKE